MNKRDLIDAISGRLGDKKTATEAVNAVLDTIQDTVAKGDKVSITGFGVFEKTVRPARTARNPATGAAIKVPKSSVPKFRAGAGRTRAGRSRWLSAGQAACAGRW
ncbi:MAG: HU family DNA-binding protein [Streptosporangiaceae bacterium]